MDTILASIRRILNEDEVSPAEAASKHDDVAPAADKDDVLVLGESMMVPSEPVEPPAPIAAAQPESPVVVPAEGLVAARTRAAAAQSFDALHEAMQRAQIPAPVVNSPTLLRAGGATIEDLVRDELRSLLSNWLDVHLPTLVETLVRSEIEKLTRR
jgi:cell pole-organizing protein PopZ